MARRNLSVARFLLENKMKKILAILLLAMTASVQAGEVQITEAWARATAPGQDTAMVAMTILSQKDGNVVAVSSDTSNSAEIHSMIHENGVMKMRALESLPLKANESTAIGKGNHFMLFGLKKPLVAGDNVAISVTVRFANKKEEVVKAIAVVKPLMDAGEHMHHHH
jgi:copper(I)-binding protein